METGKLRIIKRYHPEEQALGSDRTSADSLARSESLKDSTDSIVLDSMFKPMLVTMRGQRGDVASAEEKLLFIVNSSCSKRSVPVPANLYKILERQLNRLRRKHSVKASFAVQMSGDVKAALEIEGILSNVYRQSHQRYPDDDH
jgi:hypothetical protein